MSLTFQALADILPAAAVEFVGNNQLKINFSQLTGDQDLNFDSSLVKGVVQLLQGLAKLTDQINQQRASQTPPLPSINFVSQELEGTPQKPKYVFTLEVAVDTKAFVSSLVDPTIN